MAAYVPACKGLGRAEIEQIQLEKLQTVINRVSRNVKYYSELFKSLDILPNDFQSLEDLKKIPTTDRSIVAKNQPYGMFAVPLREVVHLHSIPSEEGGQIVMGYTRNDRDHWAELVARSFYEAKVDHDDVVQIMADYGHFPGAFGAHLGAERIGASVIPSSNLSLDEQIEVLQNFRTTVIVSTPAYLLHLVRRIREKSVDPNSFQLKCGIFIGEDWAEEVRNEVEEVLQVSVYGAFGLAEILIPGIATESPFKDGFHVYEDHFYVEILGVGTDEPMPRGEEGELVITTLTKEAFPLIRYRTGYRTRIFSEKGRFGCAFIRIDKAVSLSKMVLSIDGVRIFPGQVKRILSLLELPIPRFRLVARRGEAGDYLEIETEITDELFTDEIKHVQILKEHLESEVYDKFKIRTAVKFVEQETLKGKSLVLDSR